MTKAEVKEYVDSYTEFLQNIEHDAISREDAQTIFIASHVKRSAEALMIEMRFLVELIKAI